MHLYCTMCKAITDHELDITYEDIHCSCLNMRHGEKPFE